MSIERKVHKLLSVVFVFGLIASVVVLGEKVGLVPTYISGVVQVAFIGFVAISHEYIDRNW